MGHEIFPLVSSLPDSSFPRAIVSKLDELASAMLGDLLQNSIVLSKVIEGGISYKTGDMLCEPLSK